MGLSSVTFIVKVLIFFTIESVTLKPGAVSLIEDKPSDSLLTLQGAKRDTLTSIFALGPLNYLIFLNKLMLLVLSLSFLCRAKYSD